MRVILAHEYIANDRDRVGNPLDEDGTEETIAKQVVLWLYLIGPPAQINYCYGSYYTPKLGICCGRSDRTHKSPSGTARYSRIN